MERINFKITPVFILIFLISFDCLAGMGGGGGGGGNGGGNMGGGMGTCGWGPFPPCPVPIDSNIIGLLFAGGLYGAYKIYMITKKNRA